MNVRIIRPVLLLGVLVVVCSAPALGDYEIRWHTIDGGGGVSSGGPYTVMVTIGQPEAGVMTGGSYELLGGFWPGEPLCTVNFYHYARFAEWWLETGAGLPADLYVDQYNIVDGFDLGVLVDYWLCYCPLDWSLK